MASEGRSYPVNGYRITMDRASITRSGCSYLLEEVTMDRNMSRVSVFVFVLLACPQFAQAGVCPCDADVDNNGVVDLIDGACIATCRDGDCTCCISSCDVNCDGVVDANDIGDDPINDPSAWQCRFTGGSVETCCPPPTGACCQVDSGTCTENVIQANCGAANQIWNEGLTCAAAGCPTLPVGACCDLDFGTCTENVLQADCGQANQTWNDGLTCAAAACPAPPTGACCLGNGTCMEAAVQANCNTADRTWNQGVACAAIDCTLPIPDPCACDADVDNSGVVDLIDGACIATCRDGDCICCVNSCDINCDGVVDAGDIGDDPANDPSAWLCRFTGMPAETCCPLPTGACCQVDTLSCTENEFQADCGAANQIWNEGLTCATAGCPALPVGACCDLDFGTCAENVLQADCGQANQTWNEGLDCATAACPAPPTGSCCLGNGTCQEAAIQANCNAADRTWNQGLVCAAVDCTLPIPDPCVCSADVDNSGVVDIGDAVCIFNCRSGDCTCCLSSCDINCDGVVNTEDLANDVLDVPSMWRCLFTGQQPDYCCSAEFQDILSALSNVPAASDWGLVAMTLLLLAAGTVMLRSRAVRPDAGN